MKKTKKLFVPLVLTLALILPPFHLYIKEKYEYDVRSNVVKLMGKKGGACTGTQIVAPSGHKYILTASHCNVLATDGKILVAAEGLRTIELPIVEDSDTTDLMLLEGHPALSGIDVATNIYPKRELRAYTHGAGMATFKAVGEFVQEEVIEVIISLVNSSDEEAACTAKPKFRVKDVPMLFFVLRACVLHLDSYATTIQPIIPGSSGGAIVQGNKVVGVVSAGGGGFTFIVKFSELKEFLAPY